MTDTDESTRKIELVLEVNRIFKRYQLELSAGHAKAAVEGLGWYDIAGFLGEATEILRAMSDGRLLHSVLIGEEFGSRIVTIDLFKGTFAHVDDWVERIEALAAAHGASHTESFEIPRAAVEIRARWDK